MNNPGKDYLHKIFTSDLKQKSFDDGFAHSLLVDESLEEMPNNPQTYTVAFALSRTLSRQVSAEQRNLETIGLEQSISALRGLEADKDIELSEVQTDQYIGTFFVYENAPVGLAFVNRGFSKGIKHNSG